jgi:hypothetical protein
VILHPEILQKSIDEKLTQLQVKELNQDVKADYIRNELGTLLEERQWIIRQGRKRILSIDDVEHQLTEIDFQQINLEKKLAEIEAVKAAQMKAEACKQWAANYLGDIGQGLSLLDINPQELNEEIREQLYVELEARQFLDKFDGDRDKAIDWAHLEKRREIVSTLVKRVLVTRGKGKERIIEPVIVVEIPIDKNESLYYSNQSLEYIEQVRQVTLGD